LRTVDGEERKHQVEAVRKRVGGGLGPIRRLKLKSRHRFLELARVKENYPEIVESDRGDVIEA
jgi:hypothetical protein